MENNIHKGSEFNNINETWNQNERERERGNSLGRNDNEADDAPATGNNLEQKIKEEAAEYDNVNKEERLLSGERATVNDDQSDDANE